MLVSTSRTIVRLLAKSRHQAASLYSTATVPHDQVLQSSYAPVPIPHMNTADYCLANCDQYAGAPAMECTATGKMLTYADVKMMSRQFGSQLLHSGLRPGDKIATFIPNCPEFGPVLLGSLGTGVTLVPMSPMLGASEVSRLLAIAQPRLVVTNDQLLPVLTQAVAMAGCQHTIEIVTVTDSSSSSAVPLAQYCDNDATGYDDRPTFDLDTTLGILPFSSGTTGLPKGVMLSHTNLTSAIALTNNKQSGCAYGPWSPGTESQRSMLSVIPMFHIFGLTMNVLQPLTGGHHMIIMPKFEPKSFIDNLAKFTPTIINIVPPLVMMCALNPAITKEQHLGQTRVVSSGGSPVASQIIDKLRDKLHPDCELKEGYGLTECPLVARQKKTDVLKKNSVGKIVSNISYKVVDLDTGHSCGVGQPGELLLKAPHVTGGYYQNEEANNEAFTDGWFRTGDVIVYDEDGDIFIVDRIKDMIKVKGYQVSPTELEDEIRKAPGVADVAVIGVKDDISGEVPKAFIVPSSKDVSQQDVEEFLSSRLAKYKQLKGGVVFLDALPKSPTGKVLRKELRLL